MNYQAFYENYHRRRQLPKRIINKKNFTYRHILAALDQAGNFKNLLDFGSGVGSLSLYLAEQGKRVTGIELSQKAIQVARKSAEKFKLTHRVKFIYRDIFKTKLKQKFDLVICSEVLEHLPNDNLAIKRLGALLTDRGRLLISVPSINAPLIKFKVIKHFDAWSGHLRRYTLESLTLLIAKYGFKIIYAKKNEGILRNTLFVFPRFGNQIIRLANRFAIISDLLTAIDNVFLKLFGESQIIVVATTAGKV